MNFALQKTLELLIIIGLGIFLQKKVAKQDLKGVKVLVLSVALPATIFAALLKIELKGTLLVFPLLALCFNLLMLLASKYVLASTLPTEENAKKRTLMMLLPSLAPGLSCFPFLVVYIGEDSLALAALADVGNKVFGLILLYLLAMHWYHKRSIKEADSSTGGKLKSLVMSLINEPINIVIILGLIMLSFGLNLTSLPGFLQNTVLSMKVLMTPLVLLFIGMAVRINPGEFGMILSLLVRRDGIAFLLSGIFVLLVPSLAPAMILLLVVFPQSSCSFWPYAHMSTVSAMEDKDEQKEPTFDINFGVNILACSLPFSTLLIIGVFSFSDFFLPALNLVLLGSMMVAISFAPVLYKKFKTIKKGKKIENFSVIPSNENN